MKLSVIFFIQAFTRKVSTKLSLRCWADIKGQEYRQTRLHMSSDAAVLLRKAASSRGSDLTEQQRRYNTAITQVTATIVKYQQFVSDVDTEA